MLKKAAFSPAQPRRAKTRRSAGKAAGGARTGGIPSGAHGATNKEHHVCARRRVGETAGSPLRILASRERRMGKGARPRAPGSGG